MFMLDWFLQRQQIAMLLVVAYVLPLTGCQHMSDRDGARQGRGNTLLIPEKTAFAPEITVPASVRLECNIERKLSEYVKKEASSVYPQVKTAPSVSAAIPGSVLTMQITSAPGWESDWHGGGRGKREMTVRGILYENGKERGNFLVNRHTARSKGFVPYRGTCNMLDNIARKMADDIAGWLESPSMGARLGDAEN
jgi:hypothetical protein